MAPLGKSEKARQTFDRLTKLRKDASKPVSIRLRTELWLQVDQRAREEGRAMSELIRQAIVEYLAP